jgi:hypothetical protein
MIGKRKHFELALKSGMKDLIHQYDTRLGMLRLVQLLEKNSEVMFYIPKLTENDIWINGERVPFADVVGRYWFGQAKHCDAETDTVSIDATEELKGLPENHLGLAILRALVETWKGTLGNDMLDTAESMKQLNTRDVGRHIVSSAYPINMLDTPRSPESVEYLQIEKNNRKWVVTDGLRKQFGIPTVTALPGMTFLRCQDQAEALGQKRRVGI